MAKSELNFGSLDHRQLHLRWFTPQTFNGYDESTGEFPLQWRKLFNPRRWLELLFSRNSYRWHLTHHRDANHRCWCMAGTMFDGNICFVGFTFQWFYSRFDGDVPCWCDQAIADEFPEVEVSRA